MLRPDGSIGPWWFSIKDGRVHEAGPSARGARTLDFGTRLVVPGAVDPHVHFRDPGAPQKEDFASGTRAAALGGVTTVLDMPNTSPPTFTAEALSDKLARAREKACVDFGLHAGLDAEGKALEILPLASSMKIYLGATTGNLLVRDAALVRRALEAAASAGRTVAFHAESQACLDAHAHEADDTYPSHATSRPARCEADAIRDIEEAALATGARVHIAHLTSREGLDALAGTGFTAEVAPHHLLFTHDKLREGGAFKMNPPLRSAEDVEALWMGLSDGRIACLASDHAPHTPDEKRAARMPECPAGVPGVQTLLPVLLPHAGVRIDLARLIDASRAAGRVFGLPKGTLAAGYDADFAVYELTSERPVKASDMASKAGWTPFEGMPAVFPTDVFVRGQPVVADGGFVGAAGTGQYVTPAAPRKS